MANSRRKRILQQYIGSRPRALHGSLSFMTTAAKGKAPPAVAASTAASAAAEREKHVHYKHTDACSHLRWTAKESYEYMYARPWNRVIDFYAELVRVGAGAAGLAKLFGKDEVRRNKHSTPMKDYTLHSTGEDYPKPSEKQTASISSKDWGGRWERVTFKIILSYHGGSFDGW